MKMKQIIHYMEHKFFFSWMSVFLATKKVEIILYVIKFILLW